jgi:predicted nucleic acid-binding protein
VILVDSSVWIDFFRGKDTPQVDRLDALFALERIGIGDLILTEVLQGFRTQRDFNQARRTLETFEFVELGGADVALQAAKNFRALRAKGYTVRRTIDTIIATKCIESGYSLLHADRDFDPFAAHLGLRLAYAAA